MFILAESYGQYTSVFTFFFNSGRSSGFYFIFNVDKTNFSLGSVLTERKYNFNFLYFRFSPFRYADYIKMWEKLLEKLYKHCLCTGPLDNLTFAF